MRILQRLSAIFIERRMQPSADGAREASLVEHELRCAVLDAFDVHAASGAERRQTPRSPRRAVGRAAAAMRIEQLLAVRREDLAADRLAATTAR